MSKGKAKCDVLIQGGYYLKARCIQNSKIASSPPYVREIWDWLLKEANHTDGKYRHYTIKRGQLFRTYKEIREGLAWYVGYRKCMYNENHTKKAMKALREYRMIDSTKELGGVLITICNYDKYQSPKNYERTNESTIESTTKEPMKNQGIPDNNKNDKNDNEETLKTIVDFSEENFNIFYEAYPKHVVPKEALKSWLRLKEEKHNKNNRSPEFIIEALIKQLEYKMFNLSGKLEYCAAPTVWLNQERWDSGLIKPQPANQQQSNPNVYHEEGANYDDIVNSSRYSTFSANQKED